MWRSEVKLRGHSPGVVLTVCMWRSEVKPRGPSLEAVLTVCLEVRGQVQGSLIIFETAVLIIFETGYLSGLECAKWATLLPMPRLKAHASVPRFACLQGQCWTN